MSSCSLADGGDMEVANGNKDCIQEARSILEDFGEKQGLDLGAERTSHL